MKNSIILPLNYEKVFMIEARKIELIKNLEIYNDAYFYYIDHYEEELYKKYYKVKQNLYSNDFAIQNSVTLLRYMILYVFYTIF